MTQLVQNCNVTRTLPRVNEAMMRIKGTSQSNVRAPCLPQPIWPILTPRQTTDLPSQLPNTIVLPITTTNLHMQVVQMHSPIQEDPEFLVSLTMNVKSLNSTMAAKNVGGSTFSMTTSTAPMTSLTLPCILLCPRSQPQTHTKLLNSQAMMPFTELTFPLCMYQELHRSSHGAALPLITPLLKPHGLVLHIHDDVQISVTHIMHRLPYSPRNGRKHLIPTGQTVRQDTNPSTFLAPNRRTTFSTPSLTLQQPHIAHLPLPYQPTLKILSMQT